MDGDPKTREDSIVITLRWAVGFALVMVLVFAISLGYHFGVAYIDHVVEQ